MKRGELMEEERDTYDAYFEIDWEWYGDVNDED